MKVLHQDRWLVVADKPSGLLSVPTEGVRGRTAVGELQKLHPGVIAVHRLDRETSGVMVFARSEEVERALVERFREREVRKKYWLLVRGHLQERQGEIDRPIVDEGARARVGPGGQEAITRWRSVRHVGSATLVEAEPRTGRHNQLRLHFAAIGHPLVGERKYARGRADVVKFRRVALHAWKLGFLHPGTEQILNVTAPVPEDLQQLFEKLEASGPPRGRG